MKIIEIKKINRNGNNEIIVFFDDDSIEIFCDESDFKSKFPNEKTENYNPVTVGDSATSAGGGHLPKPSFDGNGSGGGTIFGVVLIVLIYKFWEPISIFFRIVPIIIIAVEIRYIIMTIIGIITAYIRKEKKQLSIIHGIIGGIAGFGVANIFAIMYIIPIMLIALLPVFKYKNMALLMEPQMDYFMYSTVATGFFYGIFVDDYKEWVEATPFFIAVILYFLLMHFFG